MIIDGIEVRKIRSGENCDCVGPVSGPSAHISESAPGVVYFNGNPLCVSCFGKEILEGEHRHALTGYLFSLHLDD
jgi:hypothetical protein